MMPVVDYPLKNGGFVRVDADDVSMLRGYQWKRVTCGKKEYAVSDSIRHTPRRIYMHRFLMGVHHKSRPMVDHRDGNGLNNTRRNIRLATSSLNAHNVRTSGQYRGIFPGPRGGFVARVANVYGGIYEHAAAAAIAADRVATELYGADASLNYPNDLGSPWLNNRFLSAS